MPRLTIARVLLAVAVVLFACAWFIALGNDIFDSTNAGAFGYAGLFFFASSFLIPA